MAELKELRPQESFMSWQESLTRRDSTGQDESATKRHSYAHRLSNASAALFADDMDMDQASKSMQTTMLRRVSTTSLATVPIDETEHSEGEESPVYPSGAKLWLTYISLCMCIFLNGLVSFPCTEG